MPQPRTRPPINLTLPPDAVELLDTLAAERGLRIDRGDYVGRPNRSALVETLAREGRGSFYLLCQVANLSHQLTNAPYRGRIRNCLRDLEIYWLQLWY